MSTQPAGAHPTDPHQENGNTMTVFLKLNGHPDSFTTKNGPVLVGLASVEQVTSWQGGSRIVTTSGSALYVVENVEHVTAKMQNAFAMLNGGDQ